MDYFLSISGFSTVFLISYLYPRNMGWIVMSTFTLLYAMYAVFIPSSFFPLTGLRFSFAATLADFK